MVNLFKPMDSKALRKKNRLSPRKMNNILEDLFERKLIRKLKNKDGTILYRTTPKGRNIVKLYKDLSDHLEGKEVLPHVFGVYR
jgi:predicted transcriptional regulator